MAPTRRTTGQGERRCTTAALSNSLWCHLSQGEGFYMNFGWDKLCGVVRVSWVGCLGECFRVTPEFVSKKVFANHGATRPRQDKTKPTPYTFARAQPHCPGTTRYTFCERSSPSPQDSFFHQLLIFPMNGALLGFTTSCFSYVCSETTTTTYTFFL